MGYFPNGTSNMDYEEHYCVRCVHQKIDDGGCAVMMAHPLKNYDECNDDESILHMLIPRDGIRNKECRMFHAWDADRCSKTADMFAPRAALSKESE